MAKTDNEKYVRIKEIKTQIRNLEKELEKLIKEFPAGANLKIETMQELKNQIKVMSVSQKELDLYKKIVSNFIGLSNDALQKYMESEKSSGIERQLSYVLDSIYDIARDRLNAEWDGYENLIMILSEDLAFLLFAHSQSTVQRPDVHTKTMLITFYQLLVSYFDQHGSTLVNNLKFCMRKATKAADLEYKITKEMFGKEEYYDTEFKKKNAKK